MNKHFFTPLIILLVLVSSSCQEKYPELENGIYAEFITNKGTMVAKLYHEKAPVTVANFVALAEGEHPLVDEKYKGKRFYDSITFHRVIDKFMIQGGDPTGTGSGSPGYKFEDEFHPDLRHNKPGILSMANSGPNTNGSQFFITEVATPHLDAFQADGTLKACGTFPGGGCHAVFGELVIGLEVQDSISNVKTVQGNKPETPVIIEKLNVIRKGSEAKNFKAPEVFTQQLPKLKERQAELKAEQEKKQRELALIAKAEFLNRNEELKGRRKEFPSGLAMIFLEEAENGKSPNSTQKVLVDCAGYFESGELFYTTKKEVAKKYGKYNEAQDDAGAYDPFPMIYNETAGLVPGFREAMLNMDIGDKTRVFIPYYLGYGERGRAPLIPPKTNLIFDIELVGIAE